MRQGVTTGAKGRHDRAGTPALWGVALLVGLAIGLSGCSGDTGAMGPQGPAGADGQDLTAPTPTFAQSGVTTTAGDPTRPSNDVLVVDNTDTEGTPAPEFGAGSIQVTALPATLDALDGKLSVWAYFVAPKDCGGGSPRIQITLDADGDGARDASLFGALGAGSTTPTGCVQDAWTWHDFTDPEPRWASSPVVGTGVIGAWADILTWVNATYPDGYTILSIALVEDVTHTDSDGDGTAEPISGIVGGVSYYDDFRVGDQILSDHADAPPAP